MKKSISAAFGAAMVAFACSVGATPITVEFSADMYKSTSTAQSLFQGVVTGSLSYDLSQAPISSNDYGFYGSQSEYALTEVLFNYKGAEYRNRSFEKGRIVISNDLQYCAASLDVSCGPDQITFFAPVSTLASVYDDAYYFHLDFFGTNSMLPAAVLPTDLSYISSAKHSRILLTSQSLYPQINVGSLSEPDFHSVPEPDAATLSGLALSALIAVQLAIFRRRLALSQT